MDATQETPCIETGARTDYGTYTGRLDPPDPLALDPWERHAEGRILAGNERCERNLLHGSELGCKSVGARIRLC